MASQNTEHYRTLLLKKRSDVLSELGYLDDYSRGPGTRDLRVPSFSYSYHMAEQSSITLERETAFSFMSRG